MATRRGDGGKFQVGGLVVGAPAAQGGRGAVGGSGTQAWIKGIRRVTANVTPTGNSVAAGAVDVQTVTCTGLRVGDFVWAIPPTNLEAGLVASYPIVSATDTIQVRLANPTASPITTAVKAWTFIWVQLV